MEDNPEHIPHDAITYAILENTRDIRSFVCSEPDLTDFLQNDAIYYQHNGLAATRLAYWETILVGFFTLSADCITVTHVSEEERDENYSHKKYPAIKIARFAVHEDYQGRHIGRNMLDHTIATCMKLSDHVGCRLITVDAKRNPTTGDRSAVTFYSKYGFKQALRHVDEESNTLPMYKDFRKGEEGKVRKVEITDF